MAEYLHGAYGQINSVASRVSDESQSVIVYVGTAPVHTVAGGTQNVNVPVLINSIAEARKYFGYSEDWAAYTLCEAMHVHLENKGIGPVVFINVLDPAKHKAAEKITVSKTPENGVITITEAGKAIIDTLKVGTKLLDTDYTVAYNFEKETITIKETAPGKLGSAALSITCDTIDPSAVTNDDVIGTTDDLGLNTGLYAIKNVYPLTKCIPSFLVCPGFSSIPAVHSEMYKNSVKVNGHWDIYMFVDLPLTNADTPITLDSVATFKKENGYTHENETVYFPMAKGIDGKNYHLSVLAAANLQELLANQDGIPYRSASNTACPLIQSLYLGEANIARVIDDEIINEKLNKNGIASAAYVGGRWAIWGAHSADYDQENGSYLNVAETNRMMLFYLSNDFQDRRTIDVDKPMTANDIKSIVAEEQSRLDALMNMGALTYGTVALNAEGDDRSDIMNGDFSFNFNITTTPLAKSLTAVVNWTEEGFVTYFEDAE